MNTSSEKDSVKKDRRNRFCVTASGIFLAFAVIQSAKHMGIEVISTSVLGTYLSILAVSVILYRFPMHLYVLSTLFCIASAGFGSVLGVYGMFAPYDNIIHYLSGILLSGIGYHAFSMVSEKNGVVLTQSMKMLFAVFFGIACAGIWEIYEFSMDMILSLSMQGKNIDTMSDIVAGTLGALTYCIGKNVFWKREK